jgi:hypothetical protein
MPARRLKGQENERQENRKKGIRDKKQEERTEIGLPLQ